MDIFEKARSIREMMKIEGMTQERLARVLGVSQSYIANKIRLLNFSESEQKMITQYALSERHARTILRLSDSRDRITAIEKTHAMKMSVQRCEILVDTILDTKRRKSPIDLNPSDRIGHFESCLESSLSLLREIGFIARAKREEHEGKIYFSIAIE